MGDPRSLFPLRKLRVAFDWNDRRNNGALLTWGEFQGYRWLWFGPFWITWEWRRV
jgi:hypothetical protein